MTKLSKSFLDSFQELQDPRVSNHHLRHSLEDILAITILGSICGVDNWVELEHFADCKKDWLQTFLSLPNGIPSHDTFGRVFAQLDSSKFELCFMEWVKSFFNPLSDSNTKDVIALDGKSLRGSHNRRKGKNPLHLVGAWASDHNLLLGQVKTEEKSNEIEAIPRLLDMLEVRDSIITIDAIGCQHNIAAEIVDRKGDYVLNLKENQPTLHDNVVSIFKQAEKAQYKNSHNIRKIEKVRDHGRIETRKYTMISCKDNWSFDARWSGLRSICMVNVKRTVNGESSHSTRYFLTSLTYRDIDCFMRAVRKHWDIEINLHWSLDVSFREDLNRVRVGNAAENLAIVRRIALNLLKQDTTTKGGITVRRKKAGWNHKYLKSLLRQN